MAQNYTIHTFDPGKEPFIDRNGNQWINVLFEGELSNPTKWVMRPDSVAKYKVGDTVFGRIDQVDGKNYQRFYKEQKPDGGYGSAPTQAGQVAQAKYAPKDDREDGMRWGNSLNVAVIALQHDISAEQLLEFATKLYEHRNHHENMHD